MAERENLSNNEPAVAEKPPSEEFVQLFTKYQRRLFLFILSQVPNPIDAEEILQETNVVIWKKCHKFELGTNFLAWICQIATYEILKFRKRCYGDRHLFSDEFVNQVAEEALASAEELEQRRQALIDCLGKLRQQDRELIQRRYAPGESGKSVADFFGRPANSVYQSLGRIRKTLLECINRRLAAEAGP